MFGSLERVRAADQGELIKTVGQAAAARIQAYFDAAFTPSPLEQPDPGDPGSTGADALLRILPGDAAESEHRNRG